MKIIGQLQTVAADRQIMEEYVPEVPAVHSEFIEAVRDRYHFITFPVTTPGSVIGPSSTFQHGKYERNGEAFWNKPLNNGAKWGRRTDFFNGSV